MSIPYLTHNGQRHYFGWAGPEAARRARDLISWPQFRIAGNWNPTAGKRVCLWEAVKQLTGSDLPNINQEIGDCVSWGCRNAVAHTYAAQIVAGYNGIFKDFFPPYFYGISRVQIGGQHDRQDGSTGSWAAEGVQKYGCLEWLPELKYSGRLASDWGYSGPPKNYIDIAIKHLMKTAAPIKSYNDLRDAICNGYACTIAGMKGYSMQLKDEYGKSWFTGNDQWPHQMAFIAVDDDPAHPAVYRRNSWGPNAHGPQLDGPSGGGWCHAEDIDRELRSPESECYAFSGFDGFPAQELNFSIFR